MPFPDDIVVPDLRAQAVINKFSGLYHDAERAVEHKKWEKAREHYVDLLRAYQEMRELGLDPIHTNIAYSCIEDLYQDLQHRVEVSVVTGTGMKLGIVASLLAIVLALVLIVDPSIVGLTIYNHEFATSSWVGPLEIEVDGVTTFDVLDYVRGDEMTYLVTSGEHTTVHVEDTIMSIVPERGFSGRDEITILGYYMGDTPELLLKQNVVLLVE